MIKIVGNQIWRGGKKIGWIAGNDIRASDGKKLGYFTDNHVYDENAHKIAYVEGNYLHSGGTKISLEKVNEEVEGGIQSGTDKCAVYVLLGD